MKAGVSTATLYERATNEDALVLLDGIDARIVEIFLESFCEYTLDYANLLKSRLGRLEVHSVHTLNTHFEPQLFSPNERAYNDAYGIYHNVLKCAEILNAKNYTMHGRIRMKRGAKFNNYAQTGDYFKKLTALAKEYGVRVLIGISSIVENLKDLARAYKEARISLEVGKVFDIEKPVMSYKNLGIGRLIYQLPTTLCEIFLGEVFKKGSLESLDRETLMTVQSFFENNLNVSETSRKLFVHRNTLVYRLEKIRKLTGLDLR